MRYIIAKLLFKIRFPSGGFNTCEFRPHLNGKLINTHVVIPLQADVNETQKLAYQTWGKLFRWNQITRFLLHKEDKIQMVIGLDDPLCQLLKGGIDAIAIREADPLNPSTSGGFLNSFGNNTSRDIESLHRDLD